MSALTKYYKMIKTVNIATMMIAMFIVLIFMPAIERYSKSGNNLFKMYVNGSAVGIIDNPEIVDNLMREARRMVAKESDELVLLEYEVALNGTEVVFGQVDNTDYVVHNIYKALLNEVQQTKKRVYTVKINEYTVNLSSSVEVLELLQRVKAKYDPNSEFVLDLVLDPTRELNVLTTKVSPANVETEEEIPTFPESGAIKAINQIFQEIVESSDDTFDLGMISLDFGENIEVVQAYVDEDQVSTLEEAVEQVTKDQEKSKIYEVESGDSLSVIAEKNETTMEKIIAMNSNIEDENSVIRVGDEIIVTIPEPELSVVRTEEVYYEEVYDADIEYIDNDDWYTTDMKTLQDPVSGYRKVVADVTYRNDAEIGRVLVNQDIVMEAVPKIVERGTKTPPTYLKPISGGRLSSNFGRRSAPVKGASTYHKGVDWATPIGTAVAASSGGTVVKAGWGSGYGYVVYINHPDGRQTRYGHLSKVLVKSGQTVKQGQKIALSGNTGRSSGPHIHFEILIGGSQVNPLKYLN
ncbi:MAG TPA: M23 family metallopeptidase [Lachnospiraceae bacterium]|nr:M23 family metallopeptidase [Lachnospiraceae bacterium]